MAITKSKYSATNSSEVVILNRIKYYLQQGKSMTFISALALCFVIIIYLQINNIKLVNFQKNLTANHKNANQINEASKILEHKFINKKTIKSELTDNLKQRDSKEFTLNHGLIFFLPYKPCNLCSERILLEIQKYDKKNMRFIFSNYPIRIIRYIENYYNINGLVYTDNNKYYESVFEGFENKMNPYILIVVNYKIVNTVDFEKYDEKLLSQLYNSVL